jgi:hypothetical protein
MWMAVVASFASAALGWRLESALGVVESSSEFGGLLSLRAS